MIDRTQVAAFRLLWKAFLEQFVANESTTSDLQTRRAIVGVVAFLVTPGLFLMMRTMSSYELTLKIAAARNMPELIEARLAQLAVLFVSYAMVTTGVLTVFIWDALVFDKRDSMVLGPLPLRGTTIVAAKLAALATFLLGPALVVNLTSGVPFGLVTGLTEGRFLQHLAGHLIGTIGGAVFLFCALVTARGLLVLLVSPQFATTVGSLLQFIFMSAVLCFMMVPTAMGKSTAPIAWFFGVFEWMRGSREPGVDVLAQRALIALPLSVISAIAVTFAGYWKQMRAALAPSARVGASAGLRRRVARILAGRDSIARATADFVLVTLARSRPQQVPIAITASMAVAIIGVALATREGGFEELRTPRTAVLWIPMVLGYWTVVGLRASFMMPTELAAAWGFRVHSRMPSASYWSGVRAAMIAFAAAPALAANGFVVAPLAGWRVAAVHTVVVCLSVVSTAQFVSLLVESVPFTRAYPPGHAKLKTRWPLYLLGMYAAAYLPVRMELRALYEPERWLVLLGWSAVLIIVLEIAGRRLALRWKVQTDVEAEADADPEALTVLNIGPDVGRNAQPATSA
jgi:hypothetical protein